MSPAVLLITLFFFIPVIVLLVLSLSDLKSANFGTFQWWLPTNWSLDNYSKIIGDRFISKFLGNTLFYVLTTLAIFNFGSALLIALITTHINRRAGFFFRLLWLLPRLTPSVVYILMWRRIAARAPHGILNQFLTLAGLGGGDNLLQTMPWVFVIIVNGLIGASFGLVIFTSAIEAIPRDYLTASKVDGASTLQTIRHVIVPMIRWPILFVLTFQTLSLLTSFEQILLLTGGGPGLFRTEVWALRAYHLALSTESGNTQWGYGAAWAVILVIIGVAAATIYMRVFKFDELVEEPKIDLI
ncbi:MAG: sugar ABC transporter permease [Chloroflexi bacterium]|nr:sugar ABC transporter permease [Chloroflexota bacterium]MCI0773753.1 sugar ABC transporter permease [Chloroflexota bacterium]MCI0806880.1 sugar ABC transporter permease [Chloroflexota bacterium]MCI0827521.1 sugar ABC transporter permease [Chloroflexota bacterium]MCI0854424.1 sugar ABC transporter permease [Chloroflexota bacterium]